MKSTMRTRIVSILLSFVMLIGLLPMGALTASAADKIIVTNVGATFNTARLEQIKPGSPVVLYPDMISTSKGDVYEQKWGGFWYSDEDRGYGSNPIGLNNISITGSDKIMGAEFEAGRTYYLSMEFKIKSEYKDTHAFPNGYGSAVDFSFRNLPSNQYKVTHTRGWGNEVSIVVAFTMPGERLYEDIKEVLCYNDHSGYANSNYLPPVAGKQPPRFKSAYNNYTVEAAWEGEFVVSPDSINGKADRFAVGNIYRLVITFTAKDGYKFAEDCKFRFVQPGTVLTEPKSNGEEPDSITLKNGRTKLVSEFEFEVEDYKVLDTIQLANTCADDTDFYPRSNMSLPDAKHVGFDTFDDLPYDDTYTSQGFAQHVWMNEQNQAITAAPNRGLVHFGIHLEIDEDKKDHYRFAENPTVLIEGLDPNLYWVEAEFLTSGHYQKTEIFLTLYFLADYHLENSRTGSTMDRRVRVNSYAGLKFALENPNIHYVEMIGVYDTLPMREYTSADEVYQKRDGAIKVAGQKHLVISENNILTIEQADPTAFFPYSDFIDVPRDADLTVSGTGNLTVKFGQPDYPAAMFYNLGKMNVSGVNLYAEGMYTNVYPQVINSRGDLTITDGSYNSKNMFGLENGTVMLSFGSKTRIDGGVFDATYGSGGAGYNVGLMLLTDKLELEINRGTFKSAGGINFPSDDMTLNSYVDSNRHLCYLDGFPTAPVAITNTSMWESGGDLEIYEALRDFDVTVRIPVEGNTPRAAFPVEDDRYALYGDPVWYCDGTVMGIDDHFEDGHIYKASFQLRTNKENGYRLHQDMDVVTVRVNGQKATSISKASSNTVNVEYNFGECRNAIFEVRVEGITYPRENNTPDSAASVVDETVGQVVSKGVKWYKKNLLDLGSEWEAMDKTEPFVSNDYAYKVEILVQIKGNNSLNSNWSGEPLIDAYLDGERCSYLPYYDGDTPSTKLVYLTETYPMLFDMEIEEIDVEITPPYANEHPSYTVNIASGQFSQVYGDDAYNEYWLGGRIDHFEYYVRDGVSWYDNTAGKVVYETDTFIAGHEYTVHIDVQAYPDYEFHVDKWDGSLVTGAINGQEAEIGGFDVDRFVHGVSATFVCEGEAPTYSISGTIQSTGSETDDITVEILRDIDDSLMRSQTVTGTEAFYEFSNIPSGDYILRVSKADHYTEKYTIHVDSFSVVQNATLISSNIPADILYGDVDMNGSVEAADALMALQAAIGKLNLSAEQQTRADVDGTVGVTANDALLILQYAIKKITSFPVET